MMKRLVEENVFMFNDQVERPFSQKFSLYALPLIGAVGVLLVSFFLKFLKINIVIAWGAWSADLSALLILLFEQLLRAGAKFSAILMFAYHFRVSIFSVKNSIVIFFTVLILEVLVLIFVQSAFNFLNHSGYYLVYYFLGNIIGAIINLIVYMTGLWLLFKSSGSYLDRFEGDVVKSARYWSFANFIPLYFVIIAVYYLLFDLYLSRGFSSFNMNEYDTMLIVNGAIFTVLFSLALSQKMALKRLEIPTIIYVGFCLGVITTALFALFDWLFSHIDQMIPVNEFLLVSFGVLTLYIISVMSFVYFITKKKFY